MEESKYYCKNCGARIKSTDTVCPSCGKNLREVGRRIEVTLTEIIGVSAMVEVEKLSPEQIKTLEKIYRAVKNFLASKEIESITIGFPQLISIKIKGKKDKENEN